MRITTSGRLALLAALIIGMGALFAAGAMAQEVALFDGGVRAYLDVSDDEAAELGIAPAVEDLCKFFEQITGEALPRGQGEVALFDPTRETPTRFECVVANMEDLSHYGATNATAAIYLSPTRRFTGAPMAGPGEKAGWACTWHRVDKRLDFSLRIAKDPDHGPGYGPFEAAILTAAAPDFAAGGDVALCVEMRGGQAAGLRAGYAVDGGEWVYTQWLDPTQAGSDDREPGVSDKNGPQAWAADWPLRWAGQTALVVTGYAPKNREGRISFASIHVTREGESLLARDFGADNAETVPDFVISPRQGTASVAGGLAVLVPVTAAWSTVGLRAQVPPTRDLAGMIPISVKLQEYPAGVSAFDAATIQGFEVQADAASVTLRAHTVAGLENAIYWLLDRWGCRFVLPGEIGECIPRSDRLTAPEGVTAFAPVADTSVEATGRGNDMGVWYRRNLGGWQRWLTGQHYWLYAIPADENFEAHPDWYALIGGERRPTQLCTSNPEVIARMIEVAKKWLGASPDRMAFPMDPMDNLDYCQCEACQAQDAPGVFTRGTPSMTDRVVTFVNAVAEGIAEEFPDRYVAFYSYSTHSELPVRVKPRDNVIVIVCRTGYCLLHLTPTEGCPTSDFHSFLRRWREMTPNIYTYEYDPISWTAGLPCPTYLEMGRSLQAQLGEIGVRGSYSDGRQYGAYAGTYLNRYVARRMKVDPGQKPEEVLADMCRAFFGPAGEEMNGYYLALTRVAEQKHEGRSLVAGGSTFYHELFTPEIVSTSRAHLDRAKTLVGAAEPFATRLAMVEESQQQLEGYLQGVWRAQAHDYDGAQAAFDRLDAAIELMGERGTLDDEDARRRATTMRLKALAANFPEEMGFVTKWELLGPFDNTSRDADMLSDPAELLTSSGDAAVLTDGTRAQWWDHQSSEGLLNLDQAFAGKQGDWTLSYGYARTIYNAPAPTMAQLRMDSFHPFKVFVNGKEVFHRPGLNADCPDKRRIDVRMQQGPNVIVIKLGQMVLTADSFPWGLYFRVIVDEKRSDLTVLPDQWAFKTDPENVGPDEQWQSADLDDADWLRIPVGKAWEKTDAGEYDGFAWYRVRFELPAQAPAGAVALTFGGVDEEAWVYLNGQYVGERTQASTGKGYGDIWDKEFELPVPAESLRYGATNVLAVRVHDEAYAGGIYGSVRLLAEH